MTREEVQSLEADPTDARALSAKLLIDLMSTAGSESGPMEEEWTEPWRQNCVL